jgi:hypothetical protein
MPGEGQAAALVAAAAGEVSMTEAEWVACAEPAPMLEFVSGRATDRKLRLFACACCRMAWDWLYPLERDAVALMERVAEGRADEGERAAAYEATRRQFDQQSRDCTPMALDLLDRDARFGADAALLLLSVDPHEATAQGSAWCQIARDIFGNPFRPVAVDPVWLTSTVVQPAEGIYQDRAFDRMPILADALEDAGCTDRAILDHLRSPGPHVRGCWPVDLLLARE